MSALTRTAIVTDSTSDIPAETVKALNITVIPAIVTLEGKSYQDGHELTRDQFYHQLPTLSAPPTTAAPPPLRFHESYVQLFSTGIERILSIHLSQHLSGMLDAAQQAAKAFGDRVRVFDSGQVSLGLGFQAIEAAIAAIRDEPFDEIVEIVRNAHQKVRLIACIDTLEYLKRSGRIHWLTANFGNLLRVKLLVELADGIINRLGQVRTRHKALDQLCSLAEDWGPLERLAIAHSAVPDIARNFAERLVHLSRTSPMIVDVTTAIGAHIGPGSIGVIALRT